MSEHIRGVLRNIPESFLYELVPPGIRDLDARRLLEGILAGAQDRLQDLRAYIGSYPELVNPNAGQLSVVAVSYLRDDGSVASVSLNVNTTTPDDTSGLAAWAASELKVDPASVVSAVLGTDALRQVGADTLNFLAENLGAVLYPGIEGEDSATVENRQRQTVETYFPRLRLKGTPESFAALAKLAGFSDGAVTPLWSRLSVRDPANLASVDNAGDFAATPDLLPAQRLPDELYDPLDYVDGPFYTWTSPALSADPTDSNYYLSAVNAANPYINLKTSQAGTIAHPYAGAYRLAGGAHGVKASVQFGGTSNLTAEAIAPGSAFNGLKVVALDQGGARALTITGQLSLLKYRSSFFDAKAWIENAGTVGALPNASLAADPELVPVEDGVPGAATAPWRPWAGGRGVTASVTLWPDKVVVTGSGTVPRYQASGTTPQVDLDRLAVAGSRIFDAVSEIQPATRRPRLQSVGLMSSDIVRLAPYPSTCTLVNYGTVGVLYGSVYASQRPLAPYAAEFCWVSGSGTTFLTTEVDTTGSVYSFAGDDATGFYDSSTATWQASVSASGTLAAYWRPTSDEVIRTEPTGIFDEVVDSVGEDAGIGYGAIGFGESSFGGGVLMASASSNTLGYGVAYQELPEGTIDASGWGFTHDDTCPWAVSRILGGGEDVNVNIFEPYGGDPAAVVAPAESYIPDLAGIPRRARVLDYAGEPQPPRLRVFGADSQPPPRVTEALALSQGTAYPVVAIDTHVVGKHVFNPQREQGLFSWWPLAEHSTDPLKARDVIRQRWVELDGVAPEDRFYTQTGWGLKLRGRQSTANDAVQGAATQQYSFGFWLRPEALYYSSQGFQAWREQYFTAAELTDQGLSGPSAVAALDNIANQVKYVLGLEPKTTATAGIPEITFDDSNWNYTFTAPETARPDASFEVQASFELNTVDGWFTVSSQALSTSGGRTVWKAVYPRRGVDNPAGESLVFFRLKTTIGESVEYSPVLGGITYDIPLSGKVDIGAPFTKPVATGYQGKMVGQLTASGTVVIDLTTRYFVECADAGWAVNGLSLSTIPMRIHLKTGRLAGRSFSIISTVANTDRRLYIDADLMDPAVYGPDPGDVFEIIEERVLLTTFGDIGLTIGTSSAVSDTVRRWTGASWQIYYYNTDWSRWAVSTDIVSSPTRDYNQVYYDRGIRVERLASGAATVYVNLCGRAPVEAPKTFTAYPGTTFMSLLTPAAAPLQLYNSAFYVGTSAWKSWNNYATATSNADLILYWSPSHPAAISGYVYYYYDSGNNRWQAANDATQADRGAELFQPGSAVIFRKIGTAPSVLSKLVTLPLTYAVEEGYFTRLGLFNYGPTQVEFSGTAGGLYLNLAVSGSTHAVSRSSDVALPGSGENYVQVTVDQGSAFLSVYPGNVSASLTGTFASVGSLDRYGFQGVWQSVIVRDLSIWDRVKTWDELAHVRQPRAAPAAYDTTPYVLSAHGDRYTLELLDSGVVVARNAWHGYTPGDVLGAVQRWNGEGRYEGDPEFRLTGLGDAQIVPPVMRLGTQGPNMSAYGRVVLAGTSTPIPGFTTAWTGTTMGTTYPAVYPPYGPTGGVSADIISAGSQFWPGLQPNYNSAVDRIYLSSSNGTVYEVNLDDLGAGPVLTARVVQREYIPADAQLIGREVKDRPSDALVSYASNDGVLMVNDDGTEVVQDSSLLVYLLSTEDLVYAIATEDSTPFSVNYFGDYATAAPYMYLVSRVRGATTDAYARWVNRSAYGIGLGTAALERPGTLIFENSGQVPAGNYRLLLDCGNIGRVDDEFDGFNVEVTLTGSGNDPIVLAANLVSSGRGESPRATDAVEFKIPHDIDGDWILAISWSNYRAVPAKGQRRSLAVYGYALRQLVYDLYKITIAPLGFQQLNIDEAGAILEAGAWVGHYNSYGTLADIRHEARLYATSDATGEAALAPLAGGLTGSTGGRVEDLQVLAPFTLADSPAPGSLIPLTLSIEAPSPYVNVGDTVTLSGTSGGGVEPLRYVGYFWDSGTIASYGSVISYSIDRGGTLPVSMLVVDAIGQSSTASGTVLVNYPPNVDLLTASRNNAPAPYYTDLTAVVSDVDLDLTTVRWFSNGTQFDSGDTVSNYLVQQSHVVRAVVRDDRGGTSYADLALGTTSDRPPQVSISYLPTKPKAGYAQDLRFSAIAYDPEGKNLSTLWRFWDSTTAPGAVTRMSYFGGGTYCTVQKSVNEDPGVKLLSVEVTDPAGNTATAGATVEFVLNSRPVISSVAVSAPGVARGDRIYYSASAYDPDGDTVHYEWTFPTLELLLSGPNVHLDTSLLEVGSTVTARLRVYDTYGGEAETEVPQVYIAETGLSPIAISPAGGYSQIGIVATISSPDDDVMIRYTLDGSEPKAATDGEEYRGPIMIPFQQAATVSIRARAFKDGSAPSALSQASFIFFNPELA